MRVLQINAVYGTGSTGGMVRDIHHELQLIGENSFVAAAIINSKEKYVKSVGNVVDRKLHAVLARVTGLFGYFSTIPTLILIYDIIKFKPDVISVGNLHSNYINIPIFLKAISKLRIPLIITLHDCWFYTGKCTHYSAIGCNKWITGCRNCPKKRSELSSWIFDMSSKIWNDRKKQIDQIPYLGVIGVSDWITNEARLSILKSASLIRRVYNWVDLETFSPKDTLNIIEAKKKKYNIDHKFVILGVASGWHSSKGFTRFIELSYLLSDDEVIVLVGEMIDNPNPSRIISIEYVENKEELAWLYSIADVFLQLSHEETFGLVTAEALACGTPVITNRFTANPELITEGCGYLVDTMDDLIGKVRQVKEKGSVHYRENCRNFALERFDKNKQIQQYVNIFRTMAELPTKAG